MSLIDQRISTARRRLNQNVLLDKLMLGILAGAAVLALETIVARTFQLPWPPLVFAVSTIGVISLVTLISSYLARVDSLSAAMAVDHAAGLKERLSTAHALRGNSDPFARAAINDAEKIAQRIHVPAHVPIRAPGVWPWSGASLLAAVLLNILMPELQLFAHQPAQPKDEQPQAAMQIEQKQVRDAVNEEINRVKQMADQNPALKDLAGDLKPLDFPDRQSETPEDMRREAIKQIDKVAEKIDAQKKNEALLALAETKKELEKLDVPKGNDPASKLGEALANGDTEAARKALDELKKEVQQAAEKGDEKAKEQLTAMEEKLDKLSKQVEQLADNSKMTKELQNKTGMSEEDAKKLLDKLSKMDPKDLEKTLQQAMQQNKMSVPPEQLQQLAQKLAQNQQAREQMKQMAKSMAKAAQACQQCKNPGNGKSGAQAASSAMGELSGQLSEMEMAEQTMNDLQASLAQLNDLKKSMCNNPGNRPGKPSDKIGNQGPQAGLGTGSRIGKKNTAHGLKAEKANVKNTGGQIIGQMLVDAPLAKGEATSEARNAVNAAMRDATDAIEHQNIPKQYEKVTRLYFESLAGLVGLPPQDPTADKPDAPGSDEDE